MACTGLKQAGFSESPWLSQTWVSSRRSTKVGIARSVIDIERRCHRVDDDLLDTAQGLGDRSAAAVTPYSSHNLPICASIGAVRVTMMNGRPIRTK